MSFLLPLNGQNYIIPSPGELGWGSNVNAFFTAIPAGCLQKVGGNFTLSAETDFGGSFGLKSKYLKSRTTNPSSTGVLRLANGDEISWRDSTNTVDLSLSVDASDQLIFNGSPIGASFPLYVPDGGLFTPSYSFSGNPSIGIFRDPGPFLERIIISGWNGQGLSIGEGPGLSMGEASVYPFPGNAVPVPSGNVSLGAPLRIWKGFYVGQVHVQSMHFTNSSYELVGGASALLGTNSPASNPAAPYKWIKVLLSDLSIAYIPCWT